MPPAKNNVHLKVGDYSQDNDIFIILYAFW